MMFVAYLTELHFFYVEKLSGKIILLCVEPTLIASDKIIM